MRHTRAEVIRRTIREFKLLDGLVSQLTNDEWRRQVPRPETKDPWTVKDALVHITYRKANMVRTIRKQRRPPEERGLPPDELNHVVYLRWRSRSPREVLDWHRQVQRDLVAALKEAPPAWFSGRERGPHWPYHLEGHSLFHRVRDIEGALERDKA
jgi:mycothiol maleylpyruvate isomerase-like protein